MTTKSIARWAVLGALFIIPFLSLYIASGSYFPFITGKNFAFRILVEVAFAGWLILAATDRRYRIRFSYTFVSFTLMTAWMFIANLFAMNAHKAFWSNYERMDGWVTLFHIYILMVVASAVLSADNLWRKWWLAFIGAAGIVTAYGLGQMVGIFAIHQSGTRIDATLGNAEYLAGYLLFAIAITVWQAFETRDKDYAWLKYSLFALSAVELVVLFATGTRGTLIALVGAAAFGAVLWMLEAGKQGRKGAAVIFAALILIVGGLFVARESAFVTESPNLNRLASTFSLKEALGPRLTIWDMAIDGAKERPLMGWGQEGYNYVFNQYYQPSLYAQEPWFDRAHNTFLDWLIAGGIPALIFFIATLLSAAWALYRAPVSRPQRILLLSALAGYGIQGLVVFDNLFTYIPFVMILGVAHIVSSRPIKLFEQGKEVKDSHLDAIVAPFAVVVGLVLVYFVNVPSMRASGHLIDALTPTNSPAARLESFKTAVNVGGLAHQEITEQLLSFAPQAANDGSLPDATRQEIVNYANEQIADELADTPKDARLRLQYALFLRSVGDLKNATVQSALARSLSPRKQSILIEQGIESFQATDYEAAKVYFTQAYELDTRYVEPVAYMAATHILTNDLAGAKALLQDAYGTTTVNHQILLLAYYQTKNWEGLISTVKAKLAESNDAMTGFQLAAAYSEAGRLEDARAQVRTTIMQHPDAAAQGQALLKQLGVNE